MSDTTEKLTGILLRNIEKEKDKHPDFPGRMNVWGSEREGAAWLRESKEGDLYISLRSRQQHENGPTDEFIRLWHQKNSNRFRGKGTFQGRACVGDAWIRPPSEAYGLICLDVSGQEETADPESMPSAARESHKRLHNLLDSVQVERSPVRSPEKLTDPAADQAAAEPLGRAASTTSSLSPRRPHDRDLHAEPDNVPFHSTIYREVKRCRLNRPIF